MNKILFSITTVCLILVSSFFVFPASSSTIETASIGNTLYVGGTGLGNYSFIQDAINNASDGDTVFVYNGVYNESLVINKSISLQGEDNESTIVTSYYYYPKYINKEIVCIKSDNVSFSNFNIKTAIRINRKCFSIYSIISEFTSDYFNIAAIIR